MYIIFILHIYLYNAQKNICKSAVKASSEL
jgi:hypothetical protein